MLKAYTDKINADMIAFVVLKLLFLSLIHCRILKTILATG